MVSTDTGRYGVGYVRGEVLELEPHPRSCSGVEELMDLRARTSAPVAVDLFCGAGGLSLGLQQAGFEVLVGVDIDGHALATHAALTPGMHLDWDLADPARVEEISDLLIDLDVTLIAGGPPCQPFSKAGRSMIRDLVRTGRRPPKDVRRDMWQSFLNIVETVRPPAVMMENVPDMVLDRDMLILRTIVDELEGLGYGVDAQILETREYGVPQYRQRVIIVALEQRGEFPWPHQQWAAADAISRPTTVSLRDAIGDLPDVVPGWRGGPISPYEGPKSDFQRSMRAGLPDSGRTVLTDHVTRAVREDDLEVFKILESDMRYSELPAELKRYRDDIFDDKYKRLDWDKPSRTITAHIAKDGYWYIHPEYHRTLTLREAARIQTFPDDVRFAGPPTAALAQIGNAVPPELGRHLGRALLGALETPRQRAWQTREVSEALAEWWRRPRRPGLPWLEAENRWTALQAEFLLDRARPRLAYQVWQFLSTLRTPALTVEHRDDLRSVLTGLQRAERLPALLDIAHHLLEHPQDLESRDGLRRAGVPPGVLDTTLRIKPVGNEDPVTARTGILRLAAFFHESRVDQFNRRSDGRIAVARLVGVEPPDIDAPGADAVAVAGPAHLALFELAETVCRPEDQDHDNCPLRVWCPAASAPQPDGAAKLPYDPYV